MSEKENFYIYNIFKLMAIVIIGFCFLVLSLLVCKQDYDGLYLINEVPSMCSALISSTVILILEFVFWYINPISKIKRMN